MVSFTITPLTDHTGAEVIGLDFTQLIDIETRATLSRAFAERHVLVMRNLKAVHVAWRTRKRWRSSTS